MIHLAPITPDSDPITNRTLVEFIILQDFLKFAVIHIRTGDFQVDGCGAAEKNCDRGSACNATIDLRGVDNMFDNSWPRTVLVWTAAACAFALALS